MGIVSSERSVIRFTVISSIIDRLGGSWWITSVRNKAFLKRLFKSLSRSNFELYYYGIITFYFMNIYNERYLEEKSKDGSWGDDIEIQAISEIYHRYGL
jgi:hypothetical protein